MHKLLVLVALLGACSNSREQQCQKVLDRFLAEAPKNIEDAIAGAGSAEREELRKQGDKEVQQMRDKFVDVCKKADDFDPDCYEKTKPKDGEKHDRCKKIRKAIDGVVYRTSP